MNAPVHMLQREAQLANEYRYSRKHIDRYIDQEIRNHPDMEAKVQHGIALLQGWLNQSYYPSKDARLAQLHGMDLEETVRRIFVGVAYCQTPELFTSVTGQLAGALKMSDKGDSILTIGEMLAVLCITDAFDIIKADRSASLVVQSLIPLSEELLGYIHQSRYLPPMVCEPMPVTSNFESPYLTHNDSLILGKGNSHSEDICLDVINTQNQVPLKLDLDFLCQIEEEPTRDMTPQAILDAARRDGQYMSEVEAHQESSERYANWMNFKAQSYETYQLLAKQGNRFWLTHKVDKRGRMYAQGYHVTTQGSAFKKAMIEFADEELVTGVP